MSNTTESKYEHFTLSDRLEISILLKKGYFQKDIAVAIGKSASSISREIKNNKVGGVYDGKKAHHKYLVRRLKSKYQCMKIVQNIELCKYIEDKMKKYWAPEQIAGRWNKKKVMGRNGKLIIITAPTVYKYLYSAYGQRFCKYLTTKRYKKKPRKGDKTGKREMIPNKVSIELRPESINKRRQFGHWEGDGLGRLQTDKDLIIGSQERVSRFLLLSKVLGLRYAMDGFNEMLNPYRDIPNAVRSKTLDNGIENKPWEMLNMPVYFCHPYSSWEKGSIENAFKRLRRFIPKKSSLKNYTDENIQRFVDIMNDTPRKCLNWKTPREVFEELCAVNVSNTNSLKSCT